MTQPWHANAMSALCPYLPLPQREERANHFFMQNLFLKRSITRSSDDSSVRLPPPPPPSMLPAFGAWPAAASRTCMFPYTCSREYPYASCTADSKRQKAREAKMNVRESGWEDEWRRKLQTGREALQEGAKRGPLDFRRVEQSWLKNCLRYPWPVARG